jgi:hypothetical protein
VNFAAASAYFPWLNSARASAVSGAGAATAGASGNGAATAGASGSVTATGVVGSAPSSANRRASAAARSAFGVRSSCFSSAA